MLRVHVVITETSWSSVDMVNFIENAVRRQAVQFYLARWLSQLPLSGALAPSPVSHST